MALMREFILDETKGPFRFKVLWMALGYISQNGQPRSAEVLRRESSIARKLKIISEMKDIEELDGIPKHKERGLKSGEQKIIFDQPEIDLIRTRIEAYPYWNPLSDDSASDVYDWLNTGRETE